MKLHFESNLDYQLAAIESVCDLFRGQEICRTEFTVTREFGGGQAALAGLENDLGIGNRLTLLDDEILANLNDVQLRNGLRPSDSLASGDFTVEMETGTGKTYVYLRSIFELNRRFGFNKFVIVVPSVAIKEGVYKTLQITEEHFRSLYANTPFEILRKLAGRLEIKNADERKLVKTRQAILHGEQFEALWDRIKHKTTYRVMFDNEALIRSCVKAINDAPPITRTRLQWRKADLAIGKSGVEATETAVSAPIIIEEHDLELPDLLTDLQDKTQLTRRSLVRILTESERLNDFKKNPQEFIDLTAESINRVKRLAIVDGIKYQRIGDDEYWAQELFETEELTGYLKNMLEVTKSVHEQVIYDSSGVERSFAEQLERNEAVKVYAKLPGWFLVPTPLGNYNPDWAILVEKDGTERLYFVVETKSSLFADDLRDREAAKITCGKEHFKALAVGRNPARFVKAANLDDVLTRLD